MIPIERFQEAIREEKLQGWLFYNMRHRDKVADRLLDIPETTMNTRPWYYFIPAEGEPVKIIHLVESSALGHLPGKVRTYFSRELLVKELSSLPIGKIGVQYSKEITAISYLDYGTALLLQDIGFSLISSADLIQRTVGVLTVSDIESHERAARHLYEIVALAWQKIKGYGRSGETLYEGDIHTWITNEFSHRNLISDHPPIVCAGSNSANPHYMVSGRGNAVKPGDIILLDMFAKENKPGSIYADISWVGVFSETVPAQISSWFGAVVEARDAGVRFIEERMRKGEAVKGAEIDNTVRDVLVSHNFTQYIRHRTGHSIDIEIHGSGVNLDGVEFPDHRYLLEGSCFSIEPGLYGKEFGVRTEIDVYISDGKPVISGGTPQDEPLTL